MPKKPPIIILGVTYRTHEDLGDKCRSVLYSYSDGDVVVGEDDKFLRALLARHPDATRKIGIGVYGFWRGRSKHRTDCFYVDRIDGTADDFSFNKCIVGKTNGVQQELEKTLRAIIQPDMHAYKQKLFGMGIGGFNDVTCSLSGESLGWDNCHIDHYPITFQAIVRDWLKEEDIDPTYDMFVPKYDLQPNPELVDEVLVESFRDYHNSVARLRPLDKHIHLTQKRVAV